jgi:uncharacterized protein
VTATAAEPSGRPRLIVSVTEIRRRPGTRIPIDRTIEAHGLALSDVAVPEGAELELHGELESIHEGVVLTGEASVPWEGECRRCLREVSGVATLDVREVFERRPVEGETWPLEQDHIDIGPLLHDTALLALPLAPLCDETCEGPRPSDYPTSAADDEEGLNEEPEPTKDPRWSALDDLEL